MLATVHTNSNTQVVEAEIGVPLRTLMPAAENAQAVLIGGYHGTWLPIDTIDTLTLDNKALNTHGAAVGAGVIAALPADRCGLAEAARVVRYLAAESAGQCGPCLNGLPRMAAALAELAGRGHHRQVRADLERWAGLVTGRGACNHPDGTVRFVRSTLTVFAPEIALHARGHCSAANRRPFLPLPAACRDRRRLDLTCPTACGSTPSPAKATASAPSSCPSSSGSTSGATPSSTPPRCPPPWTWKLAVPSPPAPPWRSS